MSRTQTAAFPWGDYDVVPDEFEHWEPEPECRAKSGECDLNGRCYRCDAIEGEHCKEKPETGAANDVGL